MLNLLISKGATIGIVVGVVAVVVILVIAIIGWYISTYNKVMRLNNKADEAWSTIDVSLKKRYDLIPNLVNTVKGYAKHESGTLEAVIAARNAAMTASGDAKIAAENALSGTLKSLFALQEAYPNLKADASFLNLQNQLQSVEGELSGARRYYNGVVREFNTLFDVFPAKIVANRTKLPKRKLFEIAENERQNVKVEF